MAPRGACDAAKTERSLRAINYQLGVVLDSMLQGVMAHAPNGDVVLVNRRYFEIFGMPHGCIMPGMSLRQALDVCLVQGMFAGQQVEDLVQIRLEMLACRVPRQFESTMRQGFVVRASFQPTPDGGCVVTYEDITEKRRDEDRIAHMASHDVLTGLANRSRFGERLTEAIADIGRGHPYSLLYLDLDRFKAINDTLGHQAGDQLLCLAAARMGEVAGAGSLVARLGGDEFAILQPADDGTRPIGSLARRLIETVCAPYELDGHAAMIGVSIGVAHGMPGVGVNEWLRQADMALYQAKVTGSTFCVFSPAT